MRAPRQYSLFPIGSLATLAMSLFACLSVEQIFTFRLFSVVGGAFPFTLPIAIASVRTRGPGGFGPRSGSGHWPPLSSLTRLAYNVCMLQIKEAEQVDDNEQAAEEEAHQEAEEGSGRRKSFVFRNCEGEGVDNRRKRGAVWGRFVGCAQEAKKQKKEKLNEATTTQTYFCNSSLSV